MFLFRIDLDNGAEYGDYNAKTELVVAETRQEAINKVKEMNDFSYFENGTIRTKKLNMVDGFHISVWQSNENQLL
ncbi:hypothetical protein Q7A53_05225 [Halobacillus rhizosphaerae]|uniref:hypothetical protein n=1 Tax=Halobacillus rhizosphaerae TaxID=3064889 RepID=UPI00398B5AC4